MNQADFNEVVNTTIKDIQYLLVVKGAEYAGTQDRLANFKRGAALTGTTPLQVLFIYLSKHYDAIASYVRAEASGEPIQLSEPIEGRLDDCINYCILGKALIREALGERIGQHTSGRAVPEVAHSTSARWIDRPYSETPDADPMVAAEKKNYDL